MDSNSSGKCQSLRRLSLGRSSECRSLREVDQLFLNDSTGKVYSEKCLISDKNYLKFKGKRKSLRTIDVERNTNSVSSYGNSGKNPRHRSSYQKNKKKSRFFSSARLDSSTDFSRQAKRGSYMRYFFILLINYFQSISKFSNNLPKI